MYKKTVIRGLLLILFAIIFGAFLAHSFENKLTPDQLDSFDTGVKYQFYIGLVLLILGFNTNNFSASLELETNLLFIGVCLFSFSIYSLHLFTGSLIKPIMGPITPIGGLLMIISIALLIFKLVRQKA